MIGHQRIIKTRLAGLRPRIVTMFIGREAPTEWRPKNPQPGELAELEAIRCEAPEVYTGATRPSTEDLRFLTALAVHAIADEQCDDEFFMQWLEAIGDVDPAFVAMLDPNGEFATWTPQ